MVLVVLVVLVLMLLVLLVLLLLGVLLLLLHRVPELVSMTACLVLAGLFALLCGPAALQSLATETAWPILWLRKSLVRIPFPVIQVPRRCVPCAGQRTFWCVL